MPTAAEFENNLNEVPEAWFIFSRYVPRILVQLDDWYLRINVNSSDPSCLHFTYHHHENVSIYIHLQQGELDSVMGIKLKRLLAIVVNEQRQTTLTNRLWWICEEKIEKSGSTKLEDAPKMDVVGSDTHHV
ncbi:hypothetical protein FRC04_008326 [Tulasnella sp. 424]|nr:hypothetical protein FRC04_008326 [Tulasnella sp. 424]